MSLQINDRVIALEDLLPWIQKGATGTVVNPIPTQTCGYVDIVWDPSDLVYKKSDGSTRWMHYLDKIERVKV